mmetsp:Transcript_8243/g.30447  ORF Transcript_8243/g.30447 Transcript_8243/m.30447 type:complete len:256 (+) Transcript_8243:951-1718(+)
MHSSRNNSRCSKRCFISSTYSNISIVSNRMLSTPLERINWECILKMIISTLMSSRVMQTWQMTLNMISMLHHMQNTTMRMLPHKMAANLLMIDSDTWSGSTQIWRMILNIISMLHHMQDMAMRMLPHRVVANLLTINSDTLSRSAYTSTTTLSRALMPTTRVRPHNSTRISMRTMIKCRRSLRKRMEGKTILTRTNWHSSKRVPIPTKKTPSSKRVMTMTTLMRTKQISIWMRVSLTMLSFSNLSNWSHCRTWRS